MVMNAEYQFGNAIVTPRKMTMLYGIWYVWFSTKGSLDGWKSVLLEEAEKEWVRVDK
jgi:hypothetical protein